MTLKIPAFAHRMGEIEGAPSGAPSDSREVQISFSSEYPYKRYDYETETSFLEVLGHGDGEADLVRLNSGQAPLLKDHMPTLDSKVGSVTRAWVEADRGHAVVRFSETPAGDELLARVRSGDVTCVSFGYAIESAERAGTQDGLPVVRATRWVAKEISFVAIPADPTVGFGRSGEGAVTTISVTEKDAKMADDNNTPTPTPTPTPAVAAPAAPERRDDTQQTITDALTAERQRANNIVAIGEQFDMPETAIRAALDGGTSVDKFREAVMDHISSDEVDQTRAGATRIGMTDREVGAFSITNAVRFLMNPNDRNRAAAAFELEASRAVGDAINREAEGLFIPADVLMDRSFSRAQNTGTPAAGGALVAQDYRGGSFIDLLRNRMALSGVGVRLLQGLQGNVDIPKQTGTGSFYWFGEDDDVTDTEAAFGLVSMTPHSAGMAIPFTRRMAQQGSPDIEALVRDDLLQGMALGLDKTSLVGHASPDSPLGLRDRIFGGAIDWVDPNFPDEDELIDMETAVAVANADIGNMAYIYSAHTSGYLKKLRDGEGRKLDVEKDGMVNGYPRVRTNQVASGEAFFGNWSDMIIGMWSGLDLRVDTSTKAASDGKVLRVFADIDTAVRNLESFKMGKPSSVTS